MTHWNGRSPPIILEGQRDERRFQSRRPTVRRRHERDGADRRMNERRPPVLPSGGLTGAGHGHGGARLGLIASHPGRRA